MAERAGHGRTRRRVQSCLQGTGTPTREGGCLCSVVKARSGLPQELRPRWAFLPSPRERGRFWGQPGVPGTSQDQRHVGVEGEAQRADWLAAESCTLGLWAEALELPEENADLGSWASKPQPALDTARVAQGHQVPRGSVPVFLRNGDHRHHCSPLKVLLFHVTHIVWESSWDVVQKDVILPVVPLLVECLQGGRKAVL